MALCFKTPDKKFHVISFRSQQGSMKYRLVDSEYIPLDVCESIIVEVCQKKGLTINRTETHPPTKEFKDGFNLIFEFLKSKGYPRKSLQQEIYIG